MKGNRTSLTAVTNDAGNTHTCGGNCPAHHSTACAVARRSGFTRERAGPAGQSRPAVHCCGRNRIRG
ncbi:hypothetical protein CIK02_15850 [Pseudomonas putida]|nr:hypothetical protein CIK02_15850 [Pseudomonas putida]